MSKPKYHKDHVLVIADLHCPYEHPGYLDFCLEVRDRVKCGTTVFIGDICDNSAISFHEHDPDGKGPEDEMAQADIHLSWWMKAFPKAKTLKIQVIHTDLIKPNITLRLNVDG
jgi:hypothetical protein